MGRLIKAVCAAAVALSGLVGCAVRHEGPVTDHFDGRKFRNAEPPPPNSFWKFLRWQLFEPGVPWPDKVDGQQDVPPAEVAGTALRVSYVGHATVLLQVAGLNILTDPLYSERASPFSFTGPKRVRAPGVDFDSLPRIDVVLVSHNHYDHLDTDTLARLWRRDHPLIVTPLGNLVTMRGLEKNIEATELDWGQSVTTGGATITAEPMQHWSARGALDQNLGLWAAFVLSTDSGAIYFAGDTGYGNGDHFKAVGEQYGPIRLAVLPIGAYEPRWFVGYAHMNPEEAVQAASDLRAQSVLAHHWATFRMANEALEEPGKRFSAAAAAAGRTDERFRAVVPGTAWEVPGLSQPDPQIVPGP